MKVSPLLAPALLALALSVLAAPLHADTITLQNGTRIEGVKISNETYARVEYRKGKVATPQSVKTADVKSIEYGATSGDFQAGLASRSEGDLVSAATHFMAVADDRESPPYLRALALVEAGDAALAHGNLDGAMQTYSHLLQEFPDSRHLARALLGKGRALLLSGKHDEAAKAFSALQSDVAAKDLGEQWGLAAEYWSLLALEASGAADKVQEALAGYEALRARAAGQYPDIAYQCAVRIGKAHLAGDAPDKALPLFEEVIASRESVAREDVATAFNGRGRCLFVKAQAALDNAGKLTAKGDRDGKAEAARAEAESAFRAAQKDFLRVFVSFQDVPGQQPEALYWAAQCFLSIADKEDKGPARAAALLKRCREVYPNSVWGKKAAQG